MVMQTLKRQMVIVQSIKVVALMRCLLPEMANCRSLAKCVFEQQDYGVKQIDAMAPAQ
jgi:hypothetical protein